MEDPEKIRQLESQNSDLKFELEETRLMLQEEKERRTFYQLIADFAFAWELWFRPDGKIRYCSPSCYDLTGFSSNEIIGAEGIDSLLVYEADKENFNHFLSGALNQSPINQSLEFRILTRTKQLRWCMMNVRGVYDKLGKYLGIRASVHDISRLKRAMGHITNLERGKEYELRSKQRLQNQIELKDRELVSFLLQLSQKNELLQKIRQLADELQTAGSTSKRKAITEQLSGLLNENRQQAIDWNMVELQIEKVHPGFLDHLQQKHPGISVKDKKLCAYVRLGLSSKEISGLLNITPQSVEIARVRLRKKLKLNTQVRLSNYLAKF